MAAMPCGSASKAAAMCASARRSATTVSASAVALSPPFGKRSLGFSTRGHPNLGKSRTFTSSVLVSDSP
jgi:hypothetical protein